MVIDAEKIVGKKFRQLKASMDERVTRLWAGAEAEAIGYRGLAVVARATGLTISTVTLGRDEIRAGVKNKGLVKVRHKVVGRPSHDVAHPDLVPALEKLIAPGVLRRRQNRGEEPSMRQLFDGKGRIVQETGGSGHLGAGPRRNQLTDREA